MKLAMLRAIGGFGRGAQFAVVLGTLALALPSNIAPLSFSSHALAVPQQARRGHSLP
ncbi:MAG: hypothetical protein HC925_09200 [Coleofasciculaceae cyanobacterium SM2_3_26]|nr:hypothetical protein [Coleofasciculaceae cyanobacterium SM2_3_26]